MDIVRIASAGKELSALPAFVAARLGYFAEEDLEITFTGSDGGPGAAQAVVAGNADVGIGGLWRPLVYRTQGILDLTVIGQVLSRCYSTLVSRRPTNRLTVADLAGQRVLVPWGSPSAPALLKALVIEAGLAASPRFVSGFGRDEAVLLFERGHSDFIVLAPPAGQRLAASGRGYVTDSLGRLGGPLPWGVVYTRPDLLHEPPQRPARFLRALQRGRDWLSAHELTTNPTLDTVLNDLFGPADVAPARAAVQALVADGAWAEHVAIPEETQLRLQQMLVEYGILEVPLRQADYYDGSAAGRA